MAINFPTGLDDNTSIRLVVDAIDDVLARDHNDLFDAVLAVESKVGISASTPLEGKALVGTGTGTSAWSDATAYYMDRIGSSTYKSLQDLQNVFHSTGWVSGGAITDNGNGTLAIAAGTGAIRTSDSSVATLKFFDWSANAAFSLTDASANYVYVDYGAGSPTLATSTLEPTDTNTKVILAIVWRDGNELHVNTAVRQTVGDHAKLMLQSMQDLMPYGRVSGATLGSVGTSQFSLTSGVFWHGLTRFTTASFDGTSDTFSYYYRNGVGGWTDVAAQTAINLTNYDDGDGTLGTLSANNFGVHWIYLCVDGNVNVQYGQGDYATLLAAQGAGVPSAPPAISSTCFLVGKIIIKKSTAVFVEVLSAFLETFNIAPVTNHNDLSSIQGGTASEYYHLTSAEYTGTGTNEFVRKTSPTLVTPVLGVATATSINKVAVTAPATSATLTIADGATLTASATATVSGTNTGDQTDLTVTAAPGSDHLASGIKIALTATATSNFGDVGYIASTGKVTFVDADAIASGIGLVMCADAQIAADASGNWLAFGVARDDTWAWTVGGLIYITVTATTGNTLSQTAPTGTDDVVLPVGVALSADTMFFKPGLVAVELT